MNLFMCGAHQTRFNTTTINGHMTHTFLCDINIMSSPSKVHKTNKINIILYAAFYICQKRANAFSKHTTKREIFFFRKLTQKIKYTTKKKFSLIEINFFYILIQNTFFSNFYWKSAN